jgi:hypothetical protein
MAISNPLGLQAFDNRFSLGQFRRWRGMRQVVAHLHDKRNVGPVGNFTEEGVAVAERGFHNVMDQVVGEDALAGIATEVELPSARVQRR